MVSVVVSLVLIFSTLIVFIYIVHWRIFEKAGRPGWEAIIPVYNTFIMMKIIGKPWWWILLLCIPFVNIIFAIIAVNMLSKSFGKDEGFTVGLLLLGIVFYPLLAFGDAKYIGPYGDPAAFAAAQQPDFDFDSPKQKHS
ncbi:hypothetical protein A4D02_30485 [Niastella koreensis]|uniref:Signal peptidase I n=2 Tax=Niastella koreensis TaxID=354356 RepID=G8TJ13_NIAKG|nr:DUF5684 domain-containing protein [Niastella koreensis]AEV97530.1 hypothetical protein Niako_1155 [Niastella koreensis GR20-10]OQP47655.1 hypothetical protein A4D02_30485 [Niastella koreensis]